MTILESGLERGRHPVDAVEKVADFNKWSFERSAEDEIEILVSGSWTDYNVSFSWMEDFEALHIACAFDMRIPSKRALEALRLVSTVNEQMVFGHFEMWFHNGSVLFRHAIPLSGGAVANDAQIECLLEAALNSCERYYQAFQFVVWAGKSATEALDNVLFDTVGEA